LARKKYDLFLKRYIAKFPDVKNVNYAINYLENQYYKNRQDRITIDNVISVNNSLGLR